MKAAKEASAALLAGEKIGFYSEFPWEGDLPDGLMLCGKDGIPSVTGQMDESAGEVPKPALRSLCTEAVCHFPILCM